MKIIRKRIDEMDRAKYNPRIGLRPGDEEYESLRNSIDTFGLVIPLIWNERTNTLVGGHQRLTVLENNGEEEVEVSVVNLDETQEKQLNIALNKTGGDWDEAKLKVLLDELGDDATATGFTLPEIEALQNDLDGLIDDTFLDEELAKLEDLFNISLTFSAADKADLKAYVKDYGKESLVKLIIEKVKGDI